MLLQLQNQLPVPAALSCTATEAWDPPVPPVGAVLCALSTPESLAPKTSCQVSIYSGQVYIMQCQDVHVVVCPEHPHSLGNLRDHNHATGLPIVSQRAGCVCSLLGKH